MTKAKSEKDNTVLEVEEINLEDKRNKLISEFKSNEDLLTLFKEGVELIIKKLLLKKNINIHNISSRTKNEISLTNKIDKKGVKYESISEITDLVGIRIITYFEDDVDKIANIIEEEFIVDHENSIDKRKKDYDKFGYQSLHYIVSISDKRTRLMEYEDYKDLKAEIQIRSVLQHAWAEMEHDIGYKSKDEIPEQFKRQFSRLSAALEGADIEFTKIRDGLEEYRKQLSEKIESEPENVLIDVDSLGNFIFKNEIVIKADNYLNKSAQMILFMTISHQYLNLISSTVKDFNILTIKQLEDKLNANEILLTKFIEEYSKEFNHGFRIKVSRGISIIFLFYVLAASTKTVPEMNKILNIYKFGIKSYDKLIDIYNRAQQSN